MSWITLEEARKHLKIWLKAEKAIATAQSYKIGQRSLTRADLDDVLAQIKYWRGIVEDLEAGGDGSNQARIFRTIPMDF